MEITVDGALLEGFYLGASDVKTAEDVDRFNQSLLPLTEAGAAGQSASSQIIIEGEQIGWFDVAWRDVRCGIHRLPTLCTIPRQATVREKRPMLSLFLD